MILKNDIKQERKKIFKPEFKKKEHFSLEHRYFYICKNIKSVFQKTTLNHAKPQWEPRLTSLI